MDNIFRLCLTLTLLIILNHSDAQIKRFVDLAGLDDQIKPGDNFFRYVNGKWYETIHYI